uniref:RING-type domain-containing protein n=1 Tax=Strongyloides papillosus TaxID=174720 RepID=A0A0N5BJQ1_STREA
MPFVCAICSEAYTTNGTEHALFSTKYGHLFGKSCLEKWIQEKSRFECPTYRKLLLDSDYHPIYDVPNEFFEFQLDDKTRKCISGTSKEKQFFYKKRYGKACKIIEFFGTSNGYILIASYDVFHNDDFHNSSYEGSYFLKIYESDYVCYNRNFRPDRITAVVVNNYCKDDVEFCVGFSNGDIYKTVFYLTNGVRQTPR